MQEEIAIVCSRATSPRAALKFTLQRVARLNGWAVGHAFLVVDDATGELAPTGIWHFEPGLDISDLVDATMKLRFAPGEGLVGRVAETREGMWFEDVTREPQWKQRGASDPELRAAIFFPIMTSDQLVGVMEFFADEVLPPDPRFEQTVRNVGIQLGHVILRKDLEKEIADLADAEQRRMGEVLHDSIGQQVTAIEIIMKTLHTRLERASRPEASAAADLVGHIRDTRHQVNALVKGLMPGEFDISKGLIDALQALCTRTSALFDVECEIGHDGPLTIADPTKGNHVYRIVREAMHNAVKHGQCSRIGVEARPLAEEGLITIQIHDNGRGLMAASSGDGGMGWRLMQHRANLIEGELDIAQNESGVTVTLTFPRVP